MYAASSTSVGARDELDNAGEIAQRSAKAMITSSERRSHDNIFRLWAQCRSFFAKQKRGLTPS